MVHLRDKDWDAREIASLGGRLLLLPAELLPAWHGVFGGEDRRDWTDYNAACAAKSVELLPVGDGHGIVFADEPASASWMPTPSGGLLVRWITTDEGYEPVWRFLSALACEDLGPEVLRFRTGASGVCVLFDAADRGDTLTNGSVECTLVPGEYRVRYVQCKLTEGTHFLVHAFEPSNVVHS